MTGKGRGSIAVAVALVGLGLAACGKKEPADKGEGSAEVQQTGKELSKNPFQAMKQIGDAAQKASEDFKKAAEKAPVEPVKYDVLLPFLPAPDGWQATEPSGQTTSMGEYKVTNVNRSYTQGEQQVRLEITDGGFAPMVYAPFHMMSQFATEGTDGYNRGIKVAGNPGFETWKKDGKNAELWTLVGDRFLVHLSGDQVEEPTLRDWIGHVDLAALAKLGS
jgi:hypothetical protein